MAILMLVRNFSAKGGMERYVWELVASLWAKGTTVTVVCESCPQRHALTPGIRVIELGRSKWPSGWLRHLSFSWRVGKALKKLDLRGTIIHSHERTGVHHISTFHGPPFAKVRLRPWYRKLSPRIWAHLWMERREVCAPHVRVVVPNSVVIKQNLSSFYPGTHERLTMPVTPGVDEVPRRNFRLVSPDAGVIGFVGKEWKRKGLPFFLKIAEVLLGHRPNLRLIIVGPVKEEIAVLLENYPGEYSCLGWQDGRGYYKTMDLLLHPASSEPYGMVVAEAMAAGVPVIVSDECGVAPDVSPENGSVLSASDDLDRWVSCCNLWLDGKRQTLGYSRPWAQVADEYLEIYEKIKIDSD